MKTKLLKRVRRRYEIVKVTKIENPHHWLYGSDFPLFVAFDKRSTWRHRAFATYNEAHAHLCKMIKNDYYTKVKRFRKQKNYETKVWYV